MANGTQVTITASGAQSIYYTLDGSEPCVDGNPATGAVLYTGPVRLVNPSSTDPTNITLKACAVNSVGASDVATATYTFTAAPVVSNTDVLTTTSLGLSGTTYDDFDKSLDYARYYGNANVSNGIGLRASAVGTGKGADGTGTAVNYIGIFASANGEGRVADRINFIGVNNGSGKETRHYKIYGSATAFDATAGVGSLASLKELDVAPSTSAGTCEYEFTGNYRYIAILADAALQASEIKVIWKDGTPEPPAGQSINVSFSNVATGWESVYVYFQGQQDESTVETAFDEYLMTRQAGTNTWTFNGNVSFDWTPTKVMFSNGSNSGTTKTPAYNYTADATYFTKASIKPEGGSGYNTGTTDVPDNGLVTLTLSSKKNFSLRTNVTYADKVYYNGVTFNENDTWVNVTPVSSTSSDSGTANVINVNYEGPVTITLDIVNNRMKVSGTVAGTAVETVATPTLTASATSATVGQTITVTPSCDTEGVTYYYTLNGDTPTTSSTQMTGTSIAVTSDTPRTVTLKVIAAKEGMTNSDVATATYTFTAAPAATGKVYVKVNSTADIVDGATYLIVATNGGNTYANGGYKSYTLAAVAVEASGNTITVPPTAAVEPFTLTKNGTNYSAQLVSDNSKYFHVNSDNLSINTTVTPYINVSVASGVATISDPSSTNRYIFYRPNTTCFRNNASTNSGADFVMPMLYMEVGELSAPTFTPASGTELTIVTPVSISCPGASKIFFTIDDSTPTCDASGNATGTTFLYEGPQTLPYEADGYTIKAMGWNAVGTSPVATATYTMAVPLPAPVVTVTPDASEDFVKVVKGTSVHVSATGATAIWYRYDDGAWQSSLTAVDLPINTDCTIEVYAVNSEGTASEHQKHYYVLKTPQGTVTFDPAADDDTTYRYGTEVTITFTPAAGSEADGLRYKVDDGEVQTVDALTATVRLNKSNDVMTIKVWPTLKGAYATTPVEATYMVDAAPTMVYQLVTDQSQIVAGRQYVIYDSGRAAGAITSGYCVGYSVTPADNMITVPVTSSIVPVTLESAGEADKYYLYFEGYGYLKQSGKNNAEYATSTSDAAVFTAEYKAEGNKVELKTGDSYLKNNTDQAGFRFYSASSGTNVPQLYALIDPYKAMKPVMSVAGKRDGSNNVVAFAAGETTEVDGSIIYHVPVVVKVESRMTGETLSYSTNEGSNWSTAAASPVYVDVTAPGLVQAQAFAAGKEDSDVAELMISMVPATPTETSRVYDEENNNWTVNFATITPGAEIQYRVEGGAWQTGNTLTLTEEGTHAVEAKAVMDAWDNESDIYDCVVKVASTKPFVLVTHADDLQAGDEIIIVTAQPVTNFAGEGYAGNSYEFALAAYRAGQGEKFDAYDLTSNGIVKETVGTKTQIELAPNQTEVEVFNLETAQSELETWYLALGSSSGEGLYLNEPGTSADNKSRLETSPNKTEKSTWTISINPADYTAELRSKNTGVNNLGVIGRQVLMRQTTEWGSQSFRAYDDAAGNATKRAIHIYRRGDDRTRVARPTVSLDEGFYTASQLAGGVTLSCATEDARIFYTTDGTNPYLYGTEYDGGPIPVKDGTLLAAYATMRDHANEALYRDSYELICNYHVFTPGKKYRRVTEQDMQTLRAGDQVILVASPTGADDYYALSRNQIKTDTDEYRAAVKLNAGADENGVIAISQAEVQPLTLIDASSDLFENYRWRLYASGTYYNDVHDSHYYDGYLYSGGPTNTLATVRIENPTSSSMANADLNFLTRGINGVGNEYGGLTVKFGSPDGHDETYPNYMALRNLEGDTWKFNCYTYETIEADGSDMYYVSLFRAFDDSRMAMPLVNIRGGRIGDTQKLTLSCPEENAIIWYSLDEGATWQEYSSSNPITLERTGESGIELWSYVEDALGEKLNSEINKQHYIVTAETIFQLVTSGEKVNEGDRIIIVNAVPFVRADHGNYYAFSSDRKSGSNAYYYGTRIEEAPQVAGKPHRLRLEEGSNVVIFKVEKHSDAEAFADRPYLFNVNSQGVYVENVKARDVKLDGVLPEATSERGNLSCHIRVSDIEDYNYANASNDSGYGTQKGLVKDDAQVAFFGNGFLNYVRFNADRSEPHFNVYGGAATTFNPDEYTPNQFTWPVHIYRAVDNVMPPSITVYPSSVDYTDPGQYSFTNNGATGDREVFFNPVKVVVRQHPETANGADLYYWWGENKEDVPVTAEYAKLPAANEKVFYLDGMVRYDDYFTGSPTSDKFNALTFPGDVGYGVIRASASILDRNNPLSPDDPNYEPRYIYSTSLPRTIHFRTTPPVIRPNADGTRAIVTRPTVYTLGATLRYKVFDAGEEITTPVDTWDELGKDPESLAYDNIPVSTGQTLVVAAFKDGYETSWTPFNGNSHYADPRPMQLLELTAVGEERMGYTDAPAIEGAQRFLTYRDNEDLNYYLVTYNRTTGEYKVEDADNEKAVALINNPGSPDNYAYLWTSLYYMMAYNATDDEFPEASLVSLEVTVKDGSYEPITAVPHTVKLASQGNQEKTYYGCVIDHRGIVGQRAISVFLKYMVDGEWLNTESIVLATPSVPRAQVGYYRYEYHHYDVTGNDQADPAQTSTGAVPEQNLRRMFPDKDFLKVNVPSAVKKDPVSGEPLMSPALLPLDEVDPRQLDCIMAFYRPNISEAILAHYDIYYTITFSNNVDGATAVTGDGVYADRDEDSGTSDGIYAFKINRVHPSKDVYPVMTVTHTEYVQNQNASNAYGSYAANYGTESMQVAAVNHTVRQASELGTVFLSRLEQGQTDILNNHTAEGGHDWMYNGHLHFSDPGDVLVDPDDPSAVLDRTESGVTVAPAFYHVETYVPGGEDYASYDYLVRHVDGHLDNVNTSAENPVFEWGMLGDTDPMVGKYIARGFQSTTQPTMIVSPVYLFWREADTEGGENIQSSYSLTSLELVNSLQPAASTKPEATPAPGRSKAQRAVELRNPIPGEIMHQGYTDLNGSNVEDVTANPIFAVVQGGSSNPQGTTTPSGTEGGGIPTGVEDVAIDGFNPDAVYFTLQGIRVDNPSAGNVYIEARGNKARKVLLK